MKVKATPGLRVPREDNSRRYIEQEPVDVSESAYYHRQIADGDLHIVVPDDTGGATKDASLSTAITTAKAPKTPIKKG